MCDRMNGDRLLIGERRVNHPTETMMIFCQVHEVPSHVTKDGRRARLRATALSIARPLSEIGRGWLAGEGKC